jgi:hypothetical protein
MEHPAQDAVMAILLDHAPDFVGTGELATALGKKRNAIADTLKTLVWKGLAYSPAYGKWTSTEKALSGVIGEVSVSPRQEIVREYESTKGVSGGKSIGKYKQLERARPVSDRLDIENRRASKAVMPDIPPVRDCNKCIASGCLYPRPGLGFSCGFYQENQG